MDSCRVCGNSQNNRHHVFQEKYLGLGDEFAYIECGACGSLSIVEIPENMDRYYPETYYSYAARAYNRFLGVLKGKRDLHYLGEPGIVGHLLSLFLPAPPYIEWLKNLELPVGSSILDVGSGSGVLIVNLQDAGFPSTGIDPYIREPITFANGTKVLMQTLEETGGSFDCVMLHHCLEHMPAPREALVQVKRLLNPGGKVLIRVPVGGTHAWRTYGQNWFQLDAPRHFVVFTETGLRRLTAEAGFNTMKIVYDSAASQFWASEQYANGIPLADEKSYAANPDKSMFSATQIEEYAKQAAALNARNDGDQASFYLQWTA
ncbi:MAG: class I SAM-dependent methyltransferase [Geobacter sp.]|nr:MAG: class I SAM-dependent methyltransferase [Geobacter sp.]